MLKKTTHMTQKIAVLLLVTLGLSSTLLPACSKKPNAAAIQTRAEEFYRQEEYDKARVEYMNLLRAQPGSPLAMQRLGLIWMEHGSPIQAYPFLLKAKELDPKDLAVRRKLASVYLSLNRTADARSEATEVLAQAPEDEDSLLLLAETSATPEENEVVVKLLNAFGKREVSSAHLARAAILFRAGNLDEAVAETEKAMKLNPKSIRIHLMRANLTAARKGLTTTRDAFKAAADLPPDRSIAKIRYAEFLHRAGAAKEAGEYLRAMGAKTPDFLPVWERLAQIALAEKKPDESLAFCENIFARDPINFSGRIIEAKSLLAKGQGKAAIAKIENLGKTYPGLAEVECLLARAYLHDGQVAPAEGALTRALAAQPNYTEAMLLQAEMNLRIGNHGLSVEPLEALVKQQPDNAQAEMMLAEAYRSLGRLDEAAGIYRRRLTTMPDNAALHVLLGVVLRQAQKLDEARAAFNRALEIAPVTRHAIEQLVEMDVADKKFADARQRIQPILLEDANSAGGNFLLARIYAAEHDWPKAEATLLKTLKADPSSIPAAELLAATYLAANRLPEATAQLNAIITREPQRGGAHLTMALIHEKAGEYEKARDRYEHLVTLEPNNASVLNNLACLYLTYLKDPAKGFEAAKRARALRPNDPSIADTIGWAHYQRREYPQALAALQESVQKLGAFAEVQYHLGMVHYAMGETEPARVALEKAAASPTAFPGQDEAKRRLALLASGGGGKADLTVEDLTAMLQQQPNDIPTLLRLAEAYEQKAEFKKAEEILQHALSQNPQTVPALAKLSRLYAGPLADATKAMATAKKARELQPGDPAITALFGKAVYASGKAAWAYSLLDESVRRLPNDPSVLYDLACAAYASGRMKETEGALARIRQASPNPATAEEAQAFQELLTIERERLDLAAAAPRIQAVLARDPGFAPALMAQAALHAGNQEAPKAVAIYTTLLQRWPEFALAQLRLATVLAEDAARIDEAYALAVKARTAMPEDPQAALLLARLCYSRKDYGQTRTLLQKAAERSSLDAASLFYLGMSHVNGGEPAKARKALEQAVVAQLAEPMAAEARSALSNLSAQ
jgi:tetratricopeptide (TPR) repeat protein